MTNLHFTAEFMDILNDLLEAGITCCNVHEARLQLDYLFDSFEEYEGVREEIVYFDKQLEDKNMQTTMTDDFSNHIENTDKRVPMDIKQYFQDLNDIWNTPLASDYCGEFLDEGEVDSDGII